MEQMSREPWNELSEFHMNVCRLQIKGQQTGQESSPLVCNSTRIL